MKFMLSDTALRAGLKELANAARRKGGLMMAAVPKLENPDDVVLTAARVSVAKALEAEQRASGGTCPCCGADTL